MVSSVKLIPIKKAMLILILLFWSINGLASSQKTVKITLDFKPLLEEQRCVRIEETFIPNEEKELTLAFPQIPIQELSLSSPSFEGVDLTPFVKKYKFSKQETVTFRYKVCPNNPLKHIDYPYMDRQYLYLLAYHVLIFPYAKEDERWSFHIQMMNQPKDWHTLTSNGLYDKNSMEVNDRLSRLTTWVLTASSNPPLFIKGKYRSLYFTKADTQLIKDDFVDKIAKVLEHQSALMIDKSRAPLLIHIVPAEKGHYVLGRHPTHALSLWLADEADREEALLILSHEHFHSWIGWEIAIQKERNKYIWFEEGVNDYLGVLTAYDAGVIQEDQVISYVNKLIKAIEVSPFKNLKTSVLQEMAKTNMEAKMLASIRGHLAVLTYFPYSRNAEKNEVKKVVEKILEDSKKSPPEKSIANHFAKALKSVPYEKFLDDVNNIQDMPDKFTLFNGQYSLTAVKIKKVVLGLNEKALYELGVVQDINHESPAYQAGLRNGMKVVGMKKGKEPLTRWYFNAVNEKNEMNQYSFVPEDEDIMIKQFVRNGHAIS